MVWPSDTSYGQLFGQVQADGTVSKDVALQAFSTAIAPLPGVPDAPGGPPQDFERADGTFAIDWLMPYMDQLTPEQQAAVNAALAPTPTARLVEPTRQIADVGGGLGPLVAVDNPEQPYLDMVASDRSIIASRLHRDLPTNIYFGWGLPPVKAPHALAYAFPTSERGSRSCEVRGTYLLPGESAAGIAATIAHEVFHCFQFAVLPGGVADGAMGWITEGQAEWAGEDVAGPSPIGGAWWTTYLQSPSLTLFAREYSAVGFYEHLAETGTSPWSVFDAMLATAADNAGAFNAAGATADNFLDTWGSGVSRTEALPASWNAHGRWSTDAKAPTQEQPIEDGSDVALAAGKGTTADYVIKSIADITVLAFDGHVRMYNASTDTPDIGTEYLCTSQSLDACNCPKGFTYDGPPLSQGDSEIYLGLTGALDGASGTIQGRPLSDFCKPDPVNKPAPRGGPNPCGGGCAGSIGDPHLETLDLQPYEFQAAGEYTLLRSPDGSMEIQSRQVPYPDLANVSITTALAWKVSGHRVGMYANAGSDTYSLTLDGAQLDPATTGTVDLGSGAALTAMTDGLEVAYGDGTISTVLFHGNGFAQALDIQIAPSDAFKAQATGLLGPLGANSELPALPDGTVLALSQDRTTRFTQRYQQLAPAWHVTDQTSLFDYKTGETTASFDKADFPNQDVAYTVEELEQNQDPAAVQNANDACVGANGQPEDLSHCIFDILATKDPTYAQFYSLLAQFLANGPAALGAGPIIQVTVPPPPTPSSNLPAGFVQVANDVSLIKGATIGSDGMLYASILKSDDSTALVSVDTTSGAPGASITTTGSGGLFLLGGSVWLAQDDPTGNDKCTLERFDPATLMEQATIPVTCDISGVQAVPVADGVWWLDRSTADGDGHGGMIRHIDPATNTVDRSVAVPFVNGFLGSSPTTVIFGSSDAGSGWYRLTQGATSFTPMTIPGQTFGLYAQGEGLWFQPVQNLGPQPEADFYTSSATPDKVIAIDGTLVGADVQAIYADSSSSNPDQLVRYALDGSAPSPILTGATLTTVNGDQGLGYFDNDPLVIANQKVAKLWRVQDWPVAGTTSVIAQAANTP